MTAPLSEGSLRLQTYAWRARVDVISTGEWESIIFHVSTVTP
jgi:hypothetical protein